MGYDFVFGLWVEDYCFSIKVPSFTQENEVDLRSLGRVPHHSIHRSGENIESVKIMIVYQYWIFYLLVNICWMFRLEEA
jgi:hypothetical protein